MVLELRCWRGSRAESVHATLVPEAVSIPWPGAVRLHSLPSSDGLLLHLFVLPSVWTKFLFTFLKTTHSGTSDHPWKSYLQRPILKLFPRRCLWISRNGYPCGGGAFSSLPMWAFTSYGCGAIPPGQTWCLKQEKLVLSQCWAGRCQNHVFLTEMPRAHTLQRLQSEVHPFLLMFLGWWPHHSYSHTGLFSVCATFYLVCTMVPSSKETKGPNGESSRLSTSRSLMPSHLKDLVSKWGSLYRFQGLAFGYLLVDHFSLFRIH